MSKSRFICFARNSIRVSTDDDYSAELAALLFQDAYTPDPGYTHATIRLAYRGTDRFYYLFYNDEPVYAGPTRGRMLRDAMDKTVHALADKAVGGLLFHAAALCWNGKVVLLPADSGSGKSSLAAWLSHEGFGYLTDELAFVPLGTGRVDAFTRPLNIKTPGLQVVTRFLDEKKCAAQLLHCSGSTLIPHRLLNPEFKRRQQAPIGLIVFPKYKADTELVLRKLSPAEANFRLMGLLVNARNLPGHGFHESSQLATQIPSFSLDYSQFSDIAGRIQSIMDASTSETCESVRNGRATGA